MKRTLLKGIAAFIGMLLLILDSKTALTGAEEGIALCLQSAIPSLFPFLVLSGILVSALTALPSVSAAKGLGIPKGAAGIFLTGLFAGYPVGARLVANAYTNGQLSKDDARRMLAFCSNCGPAFIFGIIGSRFSQLWIPWALWGLLTLSAVLVAVLLPGKSKEKYQPFAGHTVTITESLCSAVKTMGYICGWIILFRIILAFADRWILWLLPDNIRVFIYGLLELTNGCCELSNIQQSGLRFVICSAMLAFGGICVVMQTASITGVLGLGQYLPGKTLQSIISIIFSYLLQLALFPDGQKWSAPPYVIPLLIVAVIFIVLASVKIKIGGRNSIKIGV